MPGRGLGRSVSWESGSRGCPGAWNGSPQLRRWAPRMSAGLATWFFRGSMWARFDSREARNRHVCMGPAGSRLQCHRFHVVWHRLDNTQFRGADDVRCSSNKNADIGVRIRKDAYSANVAYERENVREREMPNPNRGHRRGPWPGRRCRLRYPAAPAPGPVRRPAKRNLPV